VVIILPSIENLKALLAVTTDGAVVTIPRDQAVVLLKEVERVTATLGAMIALAEVAGRLVLEPVKATEYVDLVAHIRRQREFSLRTFGPEARTLGIVAHIRRELEEILAAPADLTEWVDVVTLGIDGAWRAGHEPEAIAKALLAKQITNEARDWPDWRVSSPDEPLEHRR
jgi:hypothetical protein